MDLTQISDQELRVLVEQADKQYGYLDAELNLLIQKYSDENKVTYSYAITETRIEVRKEIVKRWLEKAKQKSLHTKQNQNGN